MAPFSAASLGEYFTLQGRDVLVVFDDLTKHAWAYRELSLLLDRPPGREAYPGDIFYVQTQLMERAGKFNAKHGGASMTFLGIAETLQGDMTGYIPSNLASMCDGQIVLSSSVFAEGMRPAIDFPVSLSIIGGRVQPPSMKKMAAGLRADYARYVEVLRLSRLQPTMSEEATRVLNKGRAMMSLLQQQQHEPSSIGEEIILLYTLHHGVLDDKPEELQKMFCDKISDFVRTNDPTLLDELEVKDELDHTLERRIDNVLKMFIEEAENPQEQDAV